MWATILYRVIHGLGGSDVPVAVAGESAREVQPANEDTFHLYADYPDPFLPEADSGRVDSISKMAGAPNPLAVAPPAAPITAAMVAGIVQFDGMIGNPKKKKWVAIITVHGKEYLVRENDRVEDIRIHRIGKTRIWVFYKGELFLVGR